MPEDEHGIFLLLTGISKLLKIYMASKLL